MKKKALIFILTAALFYSLFVTALAASPKLHSEMTYDAETGTVSMAVYIKNAVGIESGDLRLAFDSEKFSYVSVDSAIGSYTVAPGLPEDESGLCTCSFMFMEYCEEADLDENGNLPLAVFKFKPLTDNYSEDDFCFWAFSLDTADAKGIESKIKFVGKKSLMDAHAGFDADDAKVVDGANSADGSKPAGGTKWYVYVIAVSLAVCAVVGVAFVAVKNGQKNDDGENTDLDESADLPAADGDTDKD